MSKTDLFRQIGWSTELIKHFTVVDDVDESEPLPPEEHRETYEFTTTTVKFQAPNDGSNVNVSVSKLT